MSDLIRKSIYEIITKNLSIEECIDFLLEEEKEKEPKNIKVQISEILHNIGMPVSLVGYNYVREGISIIADLKTDESMTKYIYPRIAEEFSATASQVERAIRHAIIVTWKRGNMEKINELFKQDFYIKQRPTNSEFMYYIADVIKLRNMI